MITTASASDKAASDKMMNEMKGMTDEQMAHMDHGKTSNSTKSDTKKPSAQTTKSSTAKKSTTSHGSGAKATGVTGLKLDADITINGKKTMLKLVEDKKIKGKYSAPFTPMSEGFSTVHIVGKIKNNFNRSVIPSRKSSKAYKKINFFFFCKYLS